jgi:hypothetical protein
MAFLPRQMSPKALFAAQSLKISCGAPMSYLQRAISLCLAFNVRISLEGRTARLPCVELELNE